MTAAVLTRRSGLSERPALRMVIAGLLTGAAIALSSLLHEVAHWAASIAQGVPARVASFALTDVTGSVTPDQSALISAAGPIMSTTIGIVCLIVCLRHRGSRSVALTVVRGVTAATLSHISVQLVSIPGRATGIGGTDFPAAYLEWDVPDWVRVIGIVVGTITTIVGGLVFGRWVLRADGPVTRTVPRWRIVLAGALTALQIGLMIANIATFSERTPTPWYLANILGLVILMPVVGALLVPWGDGGIRSLVQSDVTPLLLGFVVQIVISIPHAFPLYPVTMLPTAGYALVGLAVAARHARREGSATVVG